MDSTVGTETSWRQSFTAREQAEIRFAEVYVELFDHGTDGHNAKIIIAKMASLLNANVIKEIPPFARAADKHSHSQVIENSAP